MGAKRPRVGLISNLSGERGLHECYCWVFDSQIPVFLKSEVKS